MIVYNTTDLVIPQNHCVYFLYRGAELLYIGYASQVITRVGQHLSMAKIPFNRAEYIEYDSKRKAMNWEQYFIKLHKPYYNEIRSQRIYTPRGNYKKKHS